MTLHTRALTPLAILCAIFLAELAAPLHAEAGIVVLKNGKVVVGRIDESKSNKNELVMYPPKDQDGRGEFKIERKRIRWYHVEKDEPTDRYWAKYTDDKIDKDWEPQRQKWLLRQKNKLDEVPPPKLDRELLGTHTVEFASGDGLLLSADLYGADNKERAVILLCHQARGSRGEYKGIAPRLVESGYSCLALDLRAGKIASKVPNASAKRAKNAGKPQDYGSARQDVEAAIAWLRKRGHTGPLILWGSSYSAALALQVAAADKAVAGVVAFSPGDYIEPKGSVLAQTKTLDRPLLIVAPEKERAQATELFEGAGTAKKKLVIGKEILHGSKTLVKGTSKKATWAAVLEFLKTHFSTS